MVLTCENSGWLKSSVLVREVPLFATLKLPHLFNALTVTYSLFIWFKAPTVVSLEKNPPPQSLNVFSAHQNVNAVICLYMVRKR